MAEKGLNMWTESDMVEQQNFLWFPQHLHRLGSCLNFSPAAGFSLQIFSVSEFHSSFVHLDSFRKVLVGMNGLQLKDVEV